MRGVSKESHCNDTTTVSETARTKIKVKETGVAGRGKGAEKNAVTFLDRDDTYPRHINVRLCFSASEIAATPAALMLFMSKLCRGRGNMVAMNKHNDRAQKVSMDIKLYQR